MTDQSSVAQLPLFPETLLPPKTPRKWPSLHTYWRHAPDLPAFVRDSPTIMRVLELLGPLDWDGFPDRNLQRNWGQPTLPYAGLVAAELIRLNEDLASTRKLRRFLKEHPGFIWLLGFPLVPAPNHPLGFNPQASLPTQRHLNRLMRRLPNAMLQFLLADSVRLILAELQTQHAPTIDCVSLDTKHILAWVKENNPKAYVAERFNKNQQPVGDPDCRLGCKRRHNRTAPPPTPTRNPLPAKQAKVGEYYWGYGSGIVVAKVAGFGEFVMAEMTQPFDQADVTYFLPSLANRLFDRCLRLAARGHPGSRQFDLAPFAQQRLDQHRLDDRFNVFARRVMRAQLCPAAFDVQRALEQTAEDAGIDIRPIEPGRAQHDARVDAVEANHILLGVIRVKQAAVEMRDILAPHIAAGGHGPEEIAQVARELRLMAHRPLDDLGE